MVYFTNDYIINKQKIIKIKVKAVEIFQNIQKQQEAMVEFTLGYGWNTFALFWSIDFVHHADLFIYYRHIYSMSNFKASLDALKWN